MSVVWSGLPSCPWTSETFDGPDSTARLPSSSGTELPLLKREQGGTEESSSLAVSEMKWQGKVSQARTPTPLSEHLQWLYDLYIP